MARQHGSCPRAVSDCGQFDVGRGTALLYKHAVRYFTVTQRQPDQFGRTEAGIVSRRSPASEHGIGFGGPAQRFCARVAATRRSASDTRRSEEHTSELKSLMRISYAVFCLKKKTNNTTQYHRR